MADIKVIVKLSEINEIEECEFYKVGDESKYLYLHDLIEDTNQNDIENTYVVVSRFNRFRIGKFENIYSKTSTCKSCIWNRYVSGLLGIKKSCNTECAFMSCNSIVNGKRLGITGYSTSLILLSKIRHERTIHIKITETLLY